MSVEPTTCDHIPESPTCTEHTESPCAPTIENSAFNTDVGNAMRLIDLYGDRIRYCFPHKSWYICTQKRWKNDDTGEVYRYAKATVRDIYAEGQRTINDAERAFLIKHALASEARGRINAMVEMAQSEVPVLPERMDSDGWLFNVDNGTVNLRTGQIREHRPDDFITKISPVRYDPDAKCPQWLAFLDTIFAKKKELIEYIQKKAGYEMTGETKEQEFYINHGKGQNGKSVFFNTIIHIMGDYHVRANVETIVASAHTESGSAASEDVAALKGARMVTVSEPDKNMELRENRIKDFTGQDPITARRNYQSSFTFPPEFKLDAITNHKLRIKSVDKSIWRRVRFIPFSVTIPDDQVDRNLDKKLREEASGILNWMIAGCLKYQAEGLVPPEEVVVATEDYREEMDWMGELFNLFTVQNPQAKTSNKRLYTVYKAWCNIMNIRPVSHMTFPQIVQERGYEKHRNKTGFEYLGLELEPTLRCRLEEIETAYPNDDGVGLVAMQAFMETFRNNSSREELSKKPTPPTLPPHNQEGEAGVGLECRLEKVQAQSTPNNTVNHDKSEVKTEEKSAKIQTSQTTELTKLLFKAKLNYEQKKGMINSSNIATFAFWCCENYKPQQQTDGTARFFTPAEIKAICTKVFGLTPIKKTGEN